jgi:DNA-directed RNA polymerase specialized sigma24 family protein
VSLLLEDRALLTRFRAGERKALELVYQHYGPKVSGMVAQSLTGRSPFEAGSVVQEVFARAFSRGAREGYTGLTPYLAYLSAIATPVLLNERRLKEHAEGNEPQR